MDALTMAALSILALSLAVLRAGVLISEAVDSLNRRFKTITVNVVNNAGEAAQSPGNGQDSQTDNNGG